MFDRRWRQIVGMLLWLFVLLMAGCGSETGDRDRTAYIPLTEALGSELLHVDAITVHYGDGNRLSVTDPVEIQEIVSLLKEITLRTSTGTGVGFLYRLELTEGETTVRYASDGMVNGTAYETAHEADDAARTLNKTIRELGRARIPGLFPGVEEE
ncbi:hypothetical protein E2R60_27985 [Paenibacillus dendritiformis]|uniref:hypothetical protein n=1 Tax=Paenibacillus dendritiformis TaxID=130049 RepID=UPI0010594C43|nr:hypothetical protein [Paenibacillus dendritiformis]TDL47941.1 hypothetical protein E2R60_27985 [Paenibacillus dendritiformis]